ncbi:hypothetical protein Dimus_007115 [Dionaea muscipula]
MDSDDSDPDFDPWECGDWDCSESDGGDEGIFNEAYNDGGWDDTDGLTISYERHLEEGVSVWDDTDGLTSVWDDTDGLTISYERHLEEGVGVGAGAVDQDTGEFYLDEEIHGGGVEVDEDDGYSEYIDGVGAENYGEDEHFVETLPHARDPSSFLRTVPYQLEIEDDDHDSTVPFYLHEDTYLDSSHQPQDRGNNPRSLQLVSDDEDDYEDEDDVLVHRIGAIPVVNMPFRLQERESRDNMPFQLEADNAMPFQLQTDVDRGRVRDEEVREQLVSELERDSVAQGGSLGTGVYGGGDDARLHNEPRVEKVGATSSREVMNESVDSSQSGNDCWSCPICMDPWTNAGEHIACCLPCGHLYGMHCIKSWLQQQVPGKCPQCNKICKLEDVRRVYLPQVTVVDDGFREKIMLLEARCASLELKEADWCKKEAEWHQTEADLRQQLNQQKEMVSTFGP